VAAAISCLRQRRFFSCGTDAAGVLAIAAKHKPGDRRAMARLLLYINYRL
jgi:hypothetical protein